MVDVILPGSLTRLFDQVPRRVTVEAESVYALVQRLDNQWPGMRDRLVDSGPSIRLHIRIFVDGEGATLNTPLESNSVVDIIPAVSGG